MKLSQRLNLSGRHRLPVVLQAENAECGLACVTMIANAFGRAESLTSLRQICGIGQRGATLQSIIDTCATLGLNTRAVRCELDALASIQTPAILHWNFDHFVVLKRASRKSITVHDPAVGVRTYGLAEAGNHFTGIALEVNAGRDFIQREPVERVQLSHFFTGVRSLVPAILQILLLSALLQIVTLATPFYIQLVVDEVLVKHDADLLLLLALGFLALTLFSVLTQALRGWAGIYLTNQLSFLLGSRLYDHLLRLPSGYFMKRHMGDIVSRFGSIKPVQDFLTGGTITVMLDGVMAVTTITMMFIYSPMLASVVLASLALILLVQLAFYVPIKQRNHESLVADARTDSNFMESVRSINAIKRFGVESARGNDWQNRLADSINAKVRVARLGLGQELFDSAISGVSNVLVIFVGATLVLGGEMTIGMLYAFLAYRTHTTRAIASLTSEFVRYLMLSLHLERLADIQLATPELDHDSQLAFPIEGGIALTKASFRYAPQEPPIFKDLDLSLGPGESLAIFGPSGCGKSTVAAALLYLYPLSKGTLLVDGQPIDRLGVASLRRHTASVMQDDTLLTGSIRSNITFSDPTPDLARMRRAAETACIHEDIIAMPMGYDSLVGEMGSQLSAGQMQRILIARAIYREPRILLLDEGTAHLDRETERTVMKRLLGLGITCIYVTHNKGLLALADKILVMERGRHRLTRLKAADVAA